MEHSLYLKSIKALIKNKQFTYKELAKPLKMSESGVKKLLNGKDLSFRRFVQICDVLNVTPGHVLYSAEQKEIPTLSLTTKQQDLLLSSRAILAVYWRMVIEGLSQTETMALQKISASEINKILRKLVTADLMVEVDGVFKAKHSGKFSWPSDSRIAKTLNKEWSELTLARSLENSKTPKLHRLTALKLSEKSYANFNIRLSELLDETVRISEREELTLAKKDLKTVTALAVTLQKGVLDPE